MSNWAVSVLQDRIFSVPDPCSKIKITQSVVGKKKIIPYIVVCGILWVWPKLAEKCALCASEKRILARFSCAHVARNGQKACDFEGVVFSFLVSDLRFFSAPKGVWFQNLIK